MTTTSLVKIAPGINTELTPALNATGWSSSDQIRWRNGVPEKLGGWAVLATGVGNVLDMHAWQDASNNELLGIGTTSALKVLNGATVSDIGPRNVSVSSTPNFSTTINSTTITVIDAGMPASPIAVAIKTPVAIGGLILSGLYPLFNVAPPQAQFTAASAATSTVNNSGTVANFATVSGSKIVTVTINNNYPVGTLYSVLVPVDVGGITISSNYTIYQAGAISFQIIVPAPLPNATTNVDQNAGLVNITYYTDVFGAGGAALTGFNDWTIDNFGRIMVACVHGGPIFAWDPQQSSSGVYSTIIAQGPLQSNGLLVANAQRMIVAWGCSDALGQRLMQNNLQIRWCDAGDYTSWVASATNQAGSYTIPTGSVIIACLASSVGILIWTDIDLWIMQYIESTLVWGFTRVSTGCGLSSPHAMAMFGSSVFWMSHDHKFFSWSNGSGVQILPCPVWDAIFQNIKDGANTVAGVNSCMSEISWYYPSLAATGIVNDSYVKYNIADNLWDFGSIGRSAAIDQSILGSAIVADTLGNIFQLEEGNDAGSSPMLPFIQTGYFMANEGSDAVIVDRIVPDFKFKKYGGNDPPATIQLTIYAAYFASDAPTVYGPFTVTSATEFIDPSAGGLPYPRGTMFSFKVSSSDSGAWWRAGNIRYRWALDGKAD